jgi:hypothetical protein
MHSNVRGRILLLTVVVHRALSGSNNNVGIKTKNNLPCSAINPSTPLLSKNTVHKILPPQPLLLLTDNERLKYNVSMRLNPPYYVFGHVNGLQRTSVICSTENKGHLPSSRRRLIACHSDPSRVPYAVSTEVKRGSESGCVEAKARSSTYRSTALSSTSVDI